MLRFKMLRISKKWVIYLITFFTYSVIHSVRTCWSTLKPMLSKSPYLFSVQYLGTLDMIVLFTLAVCLNLFGNIVEKYPIRKILVIVQISVTADLLLLFVFLKMEFTSEALYLIFYGLMGVLGCLGWPICLYVLSLCYLQTLSRYFDSKKCLALSFWNSVSQFGDFLAFIISFLITKVITANGSFSLLTLGLVNIIMFFIDLKYFDDSPPPLSTQSPDFVSSRPQTQRQISKAEANNLPKDKKQEENHEPEIDINIEQVNKNKKQEEKSLQRQEQDNQQNTHNQALNSSQPAHKVNFLNVWKIPGVACTVLGYSIIKAINSAVVVWLVFYLIQYDKFSQATVIAIVWPIGIVSGSLIGAKINPQMSYVKFIVFIAFSAFLFLLLGQMHSKPSQFRVLFFLFACALSIGGPYNQMSTAVPLKLSEQPEVKIRPGAKSQIMSLMEGFGQFMCGVSVLIIPSIGVQSINIICLTMCIMGIIFLSAQILRKKIRKFPLPSQNSHPQHKPQLEFVQIVEEK